MAKNYNPRSDSSDFKQRPGQARASSRPSTRPQAGSSTRPRAGSSVRTSSAHYPAHNQKSQRRSVVQYDQSAKNDLAVPSARDERARYARFKKADAAVKVLPEIGQSRFAKNPSSGFVDEDFSDTAREVSNRWLKDQRGMTIKEHRIRQSADVKTASKAPHRIMVVLLVLVILVAIAMALYFSPVFSINNVVAKGAVSLDSAYVESLPGDLSDDTLLRMDKKAIEAALLAEPWIESVEIKSKFPSTLTLTITERRAVACVEPSTKVAESTSNYWLISQDGLWLQEIAIGSAPDLPIIRNIAADIVPQIGGTISDVGITNALGVLNGFTADMISQVRYISAPDQINTNLTLDNNVEVAFGAAEDVAAKERVIKAMLSKYAGNIVLINVRVVDRATYRAA